MFSKMAWLITAHSLLAATAGQSGTPKEMSKQLVEPGGILVSNNLDTTIYTWSVAENVGKTIMIPEKGCYWEPWRERDDGGGISIKLATEPRMGNILQFEYTKSDPTVYWDVSYIDLDRDAEFIRHNITVTADDPSCPPVSCAAGEFHCADVYLKPDDDHATRGCPVQTHLTLHIGA